MTQVNSIEQLQEEMVKIRALKRGCITNFFLNLPKHKLWIAKCACMTERIGNTLFIVKKSPEFWNVYYYSTLQEELEQDLSVFVKKYPTISQIYDIVGRDIQCQPIIKMFQGKGGKLVTSLVRMTRTAKPFKYTSESPALTADEKDIPQVSQLLHEYFNPQTEQLPYDEELTEHAQREHILLYKEQSKVIGFLIYELIGSTLYLRYWFTLPEYRNKKVGSRLLREFFEKGRQTKRQLLWVIRTNENAIKRYRYYEFKEEDLYDYVIQFN